MGSRQNRWPAAPAAASPPMEASIPSAWKPNCWPRGTVSEPSAPPAPRKSSLSRDKWRLLVAQPPPKPCSFAFTPSTAGSDAKLGMLRGSRSAAGAQLAVHTQVKPASAVDPRSLYRIAMMWPPPRFHSWPSKQGTMAYGQGGKRPSILDFHECVLQKRHASGSLKAEVKSI